MPKKRPLRVSLDTSILFDGGMLVGNPYFEELAELVSVGHVELHVSEVVLGERRSQLTQEVARASFDNLRMAARKVAKNKHMPSLQAIGKTTSEALDAATFAKVRDELLGGFNGWMKAQAVKVLKKKAKHMHVVFKDYWGGGGAISGPRNRDDIPDAFIHAAVCELADEGTVLHFVCNDNNLRAAADLHERITTYVTLKEFLEKRPWEARPARPRKKKPPGRGGTGAAPAPRPRPKPPAEKNLDHVKALGIARSTLDSSRFMVEGQAQSWLLTQPLQLRSGEPAAYPRRLRSTSPTLLFCDAAELEGRRGLRMPFRVELAGVLTGTLSSGRYFDAYPGVIVIGWAHFEMPASFARAATPEKVVAMFEDATIRIEPRIETLWGSIHERNVSDDPLRPW